MSAPGWIKIHRKLRQWRWYHDTNMVRLFLHLLIVANYDDAHWGEVIIKRGQLIFGREALARELGLSAQTIRTCMDRLKASGEVTIKSTNKFSVLTVVNYEEYQHADDDTNQQINQPVTSKQPANNQPVTTLKEEQEEKESKDIDGDDDSAGAHPEKLVSEFAKVSARVNELLMPATGRPVNTSRVHAWLNAGADPELDIYPTIAALLARATSPPTSLNYFERAVLQSVADRNRVPDLPSQTKPNPKGKTHGKHTAFAKQNYRNADGFNVV